MSRRNAGTVGGLSVVLLCVIAIPSCTPRLDLKIGPIGPTFSESFGEELEHLVRKFVAVYLVARSVRDSSTLELLNMPGRTFMVGADFTCVGAQEDTAAAIHRIVGSADPDDSARVTPLEIDSAPEEEAWDVICAGRAEMFAGWDTIDQKELRQAIYLTHSHRPSDVLVRLVFSARYTNDQPEHVKVECLSADTVESASVTVRDRRDCRIARQ